MNCAEVGERLGAYADGELPRGIRDEVDVHLMDCAVCRAEAERLTANYAYLRRTLGALAADPDPDAAFLGALRPRTKAEMAAAEREREGPRPRRGLPAVLIVVAILGVAAAGWFLLRPRTEAPPDDAGRDDRRSRAATDDDRTDRPGGATRVRTRPPRDDRIRRPDPHHPAQPVIPDRRPDRPEDVPAELAAAVRSGSVASAIARFAPRVRTPEGAEEIRRLALEATDPEVAGALLLVLGSSPADETTLALFRSRLASAPDPATRSAAAIALCRGGSTSRRVTWLERHAIPVRGPDEESGTALLRALGSEGEASVRKVIIDLLGPRAASDEETARALFHALRTEPEGASAGEIAAALMKARHDGLRTEIEQWVTSGGVPEAAIGTAFGLLRAVSPEAAVRAAPDLLAKTGAASIRVQLLDALAGSRQEGVEETLRTVLDADASADVRRRAAELAAELPPEAARRLLERAADGDADETVREVARRALEALRNRDGEGR